MLPLVPLMHLVLGLLRGYFRKVLSMANTGGVVANNLTISNNIAVVTTLITLVVLVRTLTLLVLKFLSTNPVLSFDS